MKKKNITITILALAIVSILTLSFFMGNNHDVVPLSKEDMEPDPAVIDELVSIGDRELNQETEESSETELESVESDADKKEATEETVAVPDKKQLEKEKPVENSTEKKDEVKKDEVKKEPVIETPKKSEPKKEENKKTEPKKEEKPTEDKNKDQIIKDQKAEKDQIIAEDKKNKDQKDKYQTDPVPEGKPKPVEWQDAKVEKDKTLTATLSVTAKTILNNMELFNMDKIEVLPEDGVIYPATKVTFNQGESVFDVLLREMKKNKIHMEFDMTPIYNSNYIAGINNLYEFDCGELSGWMYKVNGWFPNYGASRYQLKDNDVIDWVYTCDLGRDIGGASSTTGGGG